jgi:hypothetical protein
MASEMTPDPAMILLALLSLLSWAPWSPPPPEPSMKIIRNVSALACICLTSIFVIPVLFPV